MRNKIVMLVLSALLITSLVAAGCANPAPAPTQPPAPAPTPAPPPAPEVIKWQVQTGWGSEMLLYKVGEKFCDRVRELSGGRLDLNLLPVGAIVGFYGCFDACSKGVIDAWPNFIAIDAGKMPEAPFLCSIPGGFTDFQQYHKWN